MSLEEEKKAEAEDGRAKDRAKRHSSRSPRRTTTRDRDWDGDDSRSSKARARSGGGAARVKGAVAESDGLERSDRSDREAKERARRGRSDRQQKPGAVSVSDDHSESNNREESKMKRHASRSGKSGGSSRRHLSGSRDAADSEAKRRAKMGSSARAPGGVAIGVAKSSEIGHRDAADHDAKRRAKAGSHGNSPTGRSPGVSRSHDDGDAADGDAKRRAKVGSSSASSHTMRSPGVSSVSGSSESAQRLRAKMEVGGPTKAAIDESDEGQIQSQDVAVGDTRPEQLSVQRFRKKLEGEEPSSRNDAIEEADEEEVQLDAVAVEDAESEPLKKQIERLRKQLQTLAQENRTLQQNNSDANDADVSAQEPSKNRWKFIGLVVILLSIAIGLGGGYFWGAARSSGEPSEIEVEPTSSPTFADISTTSSPLPSTLPSNSPTEFQTYAPPSKADCDAIASGLPLADEDFLLSREFAIEVDATLSFPMDEEIWLGSIKEKLQSLFLPTVAGCSIRRWLRQLQLLPDFIIANGQVGEGIVTADECEDKSSELCFRAIFLVDLSLRDDNVKLSFVEALLMTTLAASPLNFLGLESVLSNLVIVRAAPTVPSDAPSWSPSSWPTTVEPTDRPSDHPSFAPVTTPTTLEPTPSPTKVPSRSPSMGPTQVPTPEPTLSTSAPTMAPSSLPTLAPTILASDAPSAIPSSWPTVQDSQAPSALVSVITSMATATQSSDWDCRAAICTDSPPGLRDGVPPSPASNAIDGSTNGIFLNGTSSNTWLQWNPYWQVAGIRGNVRTVRVWNRSDNCCRDRLTGVTVELLNSAGAVLSTREIQGIENFWDLTFGNVPGVATVRLSKSNTYSNMLLPEVEVLGSGGNSLLTESPVASQSSNLNCGACIRFPLGGDGAVASLAIDGNNDGLWNANSTTHTMLQVDPWWQVDLGLTATVSSVVIWNRIDACCRNRILGAKVHLKDASDNVLHTETIASSARRHPFVFPPVQNVTSIRVALENTAPSFGVLNIAEVEAFGYIQ